MNPLDALSSLGSAANIGNVALTAPTTPGAPVSEGFASYLPSTSAPSATVPLDAAGTGSGSPTTWGHMVQQMVMDVNSQQQDAAAKVNDVLRGGPTPVHQALIATEQAGLSFEFLAEVRNKITDAYQQVMQMQV